MWLISLVLEIKGNEAPMLSSIKISEQTEIILLECPSQVLEPRQVGSISSTLTISTENKHLKTVGQIRCQLLGTVQKRKQLMFVC